MSGGKFSGRTFGFPMSHDDFAVTTEESFLSFGSSQLSMPFALLSCSDAVDVYKTSSNRESKLRIWVRGSDRNNLGLKALGVDKRLTALSRSSLRKCYEIYGTDLDLFFFLITF